MTICRCTSALIIGKPKMNYGRTSEGQKDREKRPTDRNTFYRGSQIRKGNRSVDFGPFLWLFFELLVLMTLTPYKHLIKYFLCPNHNFLSIRIFKSFFCRVLGHQKVKNGQKRVLSQQILLLLYFGTPCTFSLRRVLPTAIADVSH